MSTRLKVYSREEYPKGVLYAAEADVVLSVVDYVMNKLYSNTPYGGALKGMERSKPLPGMVVEFAGCGDEWLVSTCREFVLRAGGSANDALNGTKNDAHGLRLECALGLFGVGGWARINEDASRDLCVAQALTLAQLCEKDDVLQVSAANIPACSLKYEESYTRVEPLVRELFDSVTPLPAIVKWRRFVAENDLVPRFFA